jgi:hypothetical protein
MERSISRAFVHDGFAAVPQEGDRSPPITATAPQSYG